MMLPDKINIKKLEESGSSPGLDGQRKCWYKLWCWRPKLSRSCQTSWGEQKKEGFYVLTAEWIHTDTKHKKLEEKTRHIIL